MRLQWEWCSGGDYGAVVPLGSPGINQTERAVRLVGYRVAGFDYWIAADGHEHTAEQIAFAYRVRWSSEMFFTCWKRHLKVYHLIARSKYGLIVQMQDRLMTYILLAIYFHDQRHEKGSVKRLKEISIAIRNEMSLYNTATETGLWIYQPPDQQQSYANP